MATVLLADDNAAVRHALAAMLRAAGHAVLDADGGGRALQIAATERPDVVVADLDMPDMGGALLIGRLRGIAPDVRFVGLSGGGTHQSPTNSLHLALQAGADAALRKPVANRLLLAEIAGLSRGGE